MNGLSCLAESDDPFKILEVWKHDQEERSRDVIQEDTSLFNGGECTFENLAYVGGLDISFPKDKNDWVHGFGCMTVLSYPTLKVVHKEYSVVHLSVPYISEFLAYREAEPLIALVRKVQRTKPEIVPQVLFVDGNGLLHTRGFGLACHIGVELDLPTIGVGKNLFCCDGLEKGKVHQKMIEEHLNGAGDSFPLIGKSGKIHGMAVRGSDNAKNPVYVSVGNRISLDTATRLVVRCCRFRVPEPVRCADQLSRSFMAQNYQTHIAECKEDWFECSTRLASLSSLLDKKEGHRPQFE